MNCDLLEKRYDALIQKAKDKCFEESNRSVFDFLDKDEILELERIQFKLGESDYNPDKQGDDIK